MCLSINEIFEMLDCNNSDDAQKKGIDEAKKVNYLSVFFKPKENKSVWENCAKIIVSKSEDELSHYVIDMLCWLQDLNWPGAEIIYDKICTMKPDLVYHDFLYCLNIALKTEDIPWLLSLRDVAESSGLFNVLSEQQKKLLKNIKL